MERKLETGKYSEDEQKSIYIYCLKLFTRTYTTHISQFQFKITQKISKNTFITVLVVQQTGISKTLNLESVANFSSQGFHLLFFLYFLFC